MSLVESGDLECVFPNLSGDWEKDKKKFTVEYEKNQDLLDFDFDDIYDDEDIFLIKTNQ